MTGNPSGITNPISMTTTASTARSDMVAVHFTVLCDYAIRDCPPRYATKRFQYICKLQNHQKRVTNTSIGRGLGSQPEQPRFEPWFDSGFAGDSFAEQKGSTVQKSWTHRLPVAYLWKKTHKIS